MEELKRCPFCGGEVTITEGATIKHDGCMLREETKKIGATAMLSWKAKLTTMIPLKKTRKESKPTSSKHGTNATKRTEYGEGTQTKNINDSSVGTRSCDGRADRRGIWSIHPQLRTVC